MHPGSSCVCLVNLVGICSLADGEAEGGERFRCRDAVMEMKIVTIRSEIVVWAQTDTDVMVNRGQSPHRFGELSVWRGLSPVGESYCMIF